MSFYLGFIKFQAPEELTRTKIGFDDLDMNEFMSQLQSNLGSKISDMIRMQQLEDQIHHTGPYRKLADFSHKRRYLPAPLITHY